MIESKHWRDLSTERPVVKKCPITTLLVRVRTGELRIDDAKLYLDAIYNKEGK